MPIQPRPIAETSGPFFPNRRICIDELMSPALLVKRVAKAMKASNLNGESVMLMLGIFLFRGGVRLKPKILLSGGSVGLEPHEKPILSYTGFSPGHLYA
jgi:hypothetical protein